MEAADRLVVGIDFYRCDQCKSTLVWNAFKMRSCTEDTVVGSMICYMLLISTVLLEIYLIVDGYLAILNMWILHIFLTNR